MVKHVGEDCAGAIQFVRPERLDWILSGELDSLTPLTEEDLAQRIIDLKSQARSIPTQIQGRFSLAGAQTKDALYQKYGLWFVPGGRIPSTHILKPELDEFDHHSLNEHFCLQLAAKVGLIRAESRIIEIGGKQVLCVKRYDRTIDPGGNIIRWHQEDTRQAMGRYPNQKYQADGGPGVAEIVGLLDRFSDDREDDISRFIMALALNWVIAGTDAHSKNYSLLHGAGNFLRLAPAYDLASWLPYQRDANSTKVKLAMKIGGIGSHLNEGFKHSDFCKLFGSVVSYFRLRRFQIPGCVPGSAIPRIKSATARPGMAEEQTPQAAVPLRGLSHRPLRGRLRKGDAGLR